MCKLLYSCAFLHQQRCKTTQKLGTPKIWQGKRWADDYSPKCPAPTFDCRHCEKDPLQDQSPQNSRTRQNLRTCHQSLCWTAGRCPCRHLQHLSGPSSYHHKSSTIIPVPEESLVCCLDDYHPIAPTTVIMKWFERQVLQHIKSRLPITFDSLLRAPDTPPRVW